MGEGDVGLTNSTVNVLKADAGALYIAASADRLSFSRINWASTSLLGATR